MRINLRKYFQVTILLAALALSPVLAAQAKIDEALSLTLTDLLSIEINAASQKSQFKMACVEKYKSSFYVNN